MTTKHYLLFTESAFTMNINLSSAKSSLTVMALLLCCLTHCVHAESKLLSISASNGLKYTDNDAKLVSRAFGRYVGFERGNIKVLSGKKIDKTTILKHIDGWLSRDINQTDLAVLFLAGHGLTWQGEYYFVPELDRKLTEGKSFINLSGDDIQQLVELGVLLSRSELVQAFERVATKNKLLVIDTCQSGAFLAGSNSESKNMSIKNAGEVVRGLKVKISKDSQAALAPQTTAQTTRSPAANVTFTVLAACKSDQYAAEAADLKNGVLTHYLVQVLKKQAWSTAMFDAGQVCQMVAENTAKDGWSQEAVSYGGNLFKTELDKGSIPSFSTF